MLGPSRLYHRPDARSRWRVIDRGPLAPPAGFARHLPMNGEDHTRIRTVSTTFRLAERMSRLGTEGAFETLARARRLEAEGKRIVHLEIGEPDFATPDNIVEAAIGAMQNGYTHYTPASGIWEAREAVAQFVSRMLSTEVEPADVVL